MFAKLGDVRKKRFIFIAIFLLVLALVAFLVWRFVINPAKAMLVVETDPVSQVFVNGEQVGKTPYEGEFEEHEIDLKLVPESFEQALMPYETKVFLTSGVETIVRREFGAEEGMSQGEEISFEKEANGNVSLSVVSVPEGASLYVDQNYIDLTPVKYNDLDPGIHVIMLQAEGYKERSFSVQLISGYSLTAYVEMAKVPEEEAQTDEAKDGEEIDENAEELVVILDTPTGFLRVRAEASTGAPEITQVKPGEEYLLLDKQEDWYEIQIDEETTGWISSQYATLKEQSQ